MIFNISDISLDEMCFLINNVFEYLLNKNCDINTIFGPLIFATLEIPRNNVKSKIDKLKNISESLLKLAENKIRIVYGYNRANIGDIGCDDRLAYFPVFDNFNNIISELYKLKFGEVKHISYKKNY